MTKCLLWSSEKCTVVTFTSKTWILEIAGKAGKSCKMWNLVKCERESWCGFVKGGDRGARGQQKSVPDYPEFWRHFTPDYLEDFRKKGCGNEKSSVNLSSQLAKKD